MTCDTCDRETCQAAELTQVWRKTHGELQRERARSASYEALLDCHAHAVNWRQKALDFQEMLIEAMNLGIDSLRAERREALRTRIEAAIPHPDGLLHAGHGGGTRCGITGLARFPHPRLGKTIDEVTCPVCVEKYAAAMNELADEYIRATNAARERLFNLKKPEPVK